MKKKELEKVLEYLESEIAGAEERRKFGERTDDIEEEAYWRGISDGLKGVRDILLITK